ncbi:MAG TPA: hypothetical protein VG755_16225, partial [Nannocystaceae bacterium]|nr:hypothetical protein [Nannocystaceae bacterium]
MFGAIPRLGTAVALRRRMVVQPKSLALLFLLSIPVAGCDKFVAALNEGAQAAAAAADNKAGGG